MKTYTAYIADDGMVFDDPTKCIEHELSANIDECIRLYDNDLDRLDIEDFGIATYILCVSSGAGEAIQKLCDHFDFISPMDSTGVKAAPGVMYMWEETDGIWIVVKRGEVTE